MDDRIYYGDTAVNKLRELQSSGEIEEFGRFLSQVLIRGFLSESHCGTVYRLCDSLQAPSLTRVFLERVTKQYPDSEELNIYLAEELSNMPQTKDKALLIANEMVGLSKKNGKYELSSKHVSANVLGAFMNVYLYLKRFDEILKVVPVLLTEYKKTRTQCLLYRNMVTAYLHFEQIDKAEQICRKLLELNYDDDLNHYSIFKVFHQSDRYELAYEALENCVSCDPDDPDYYLLIAGLIFDENVARVSPEEAPQRINDKDAKRYAVPFILYVLTQFEAARDKALGYLRRNNCGDVLEMLARGDIDEQYSFDMVHYCLERDISDLFEENGG